MKKWITSIILDSSIFTLIILGGFYENALAARLALFIMWTLSICLLIVVFFTNKNQEKDIYGKKRTPQYHKYHIAIEIITALLLVSVDWMGIAIFRTFLVIIYETKNSIYIVEKQKKEKEATCPK